MSGVRDCRDGDVEDEDVKEGQLDELFRLAEEHGLESEAEQSRRGDKRKFWKRVIQVTVLSEEPIGEPDLDDVHRMITEGDCSGQVETISEEEVDGQVMARLLEEQGSDPSFFQLDDDGNDLEEEE